MPSRISAATHLTAAPILALLALAPVPGARADVDLEVTRERDRAELVRMRMLGGYRAGMVVQDAYAIDTDGTLFEQQLYLDHRLRVAPELDIAGVVLLDGKLDLLTGLLGGHLPDGEVATDERLRWDASGLRHAEIRRVDLRVRGERVEMVLGLTTDGWGLGAVANAGGPAGATFCDDPFGTDAFGDQVLRVGVDILPGLPGGTLGYLRIQAMLDLVARDETTRLLGDRDLALGPGLRLLYTTPMARAGAWLSWRTMREGGGATAEVLLVDLFVDRWLPLGRREDRFRFAAEVAGRAGRSSLEPGWPAEPRRTLLAGAAVLDGALDLPGARLRLGLRAGVVSGDGDPTDDRETGFTLDRDFNAGLILFDEVLAGVGARAAVVAKELTGRDGTPLAGEGAIGGGLFALPYLSFRPHAFVDLRIGGLLATTPGGQGTVRVVSGGLAGASPVDTPPFLGGELDISVTLEIPVVPGTQTRTRFGVRLDYGHLFPGPALTEDWEEPVEGVDLFATRMGLTF